jgi:hypothetical protein
MVNAVSAGWKELASGKCIQEAKKSYGECSCDRKKQLLFYLTWYL